MPPERFTVTLTRQAENDLKELRPRTDQATRALLVLEDDPRCGHVLSGSLRGSRSLEFNLRGSGAYRAVYVILLEERTCLVFLIGPHENIYERARRRLEALRRSGELE